jgi:hypothetical protein
LENGDLTTLKYKGDQNYDTSRFVYGYNGRIPTSLNLLLYTYMKLVYKSYCYELIGSFKGWILNISLLKVFKICNSPKNFMKGTKGWKTHSRRRLFQGTPKVF